MKICSNLLSHPFPILYLTAYIPINLFHEIHRSDYLDASSLVFQYLIYKYKCNIIFLYLKNELSSVALQAYLLSRLQTICTHKNRRAFSFEPIYLCHKLKRSSCVCFCIYNKGKPFILFKTGMTFRWLKNNHDNCFVFWTKLVNCSEKKPAAGIFHLLGVIQCYWAQGGVL